MTHLYIELNTSGIEEVNASIIAKLYELASSGDLDNTSDLKGRLHTTICKDIHYNYLNNNFDELYISSDTLSITFEDSDVENEIANYLGTDGNVLLSDIQAFITSGTKFGSSWRDPRISETRFWTTIFSTRLTWNTFNEFRLFEGVTDISRAFNDCRNMTSIQLPTTVTTIGIQAFKDTWKLTSIDLSNVKYIYQDAFRGSGITGVVNLPEIVNFVATNDSTFTGNGYQFQGCTKITEVNLGPNLLHIETSNIFADCSNLKTITGLSNITSIPSGTFYNCTNLSTIDVDWSKITTIGSNAFQKCPLLSVNLANVTTIYGFAFADSSISGAISLSSLVTASGEYEFYGCKNITSISSIGNIIDIDHHMFQNCTGLTQIPDLSTVTGIIGYAAFEGCSSLTQAINIPNVTKVSGRAFTDSAISSVTLGQSCTGIDSFAFNNCRKLTSITIPNSVTYLEQDCFTGCINLLSVSFESGSNLQYLGGGCFNGCHALQSITIPDSCEEIRGNCFIGCISLNRVEIGSGIQNIANTAFSYNGISPTSIVLTIHATTPPTFPSYSGSQTLITAVYVPTGCVSVYEQHSDWSRFSGIIHEIPQS